MKTKYYLAQVDLIGGLRTEIPVCLHKRSIYNKNVFTDGESIPYFVLNSCPKHGKSFQALRAQRTIGSLFRGQ